MNYNSRIHELGRYFVYFRDMGNWVSQLVDGNADTIRAIAQGRADALVENVDFFLRFTNNYRNVQWHVLREPIFVSYCGIGVGKGNYALRDYLNVLLFDLHSDGTVGQLWEKWYDAPMTIPIEPSHWF